MLMFKTKSSHHQKFVLNFLTFGCKHQPHIKPKEQHLLNYVVDEKKWILKTEDEYWSEEINLN